MNHSIQNMSNSTHWRIRRESSIFYRLGGLFTLFIGFMMTQEPRSPELGMRFLHLCLVLTMAGFTVYLFLKPILVYELFLDAENLTLVRWLGRQKIVIARNDIVGYSYHEGSSFGGIYQKLLTLYTRRARYVLDAGEYTDFDAFKTQITKGVKQKY